MRKHKHTTGAFVRIALADFLGRPNADEEHLKVRLL